MASPIRFSTHRTPTRNILVVAGLVIALGGIYLVVRSNGAADDVPHVVLSASQPSPSPFGAMPQARVPAEVENTATAAAPSPSSPPPVVEFTPEEASASLRALIDKILARGDLSPDEVHAFQARLLASIATRPAVATAVENFYHGMPAEQAMERDILRSLLIVSSDGRSIVLHEANAIWSERSEGKFAEMYETYFNLPGQAPPEVMGHALADLKSVGASDVRTAVAQLNFIGTIAEQKNADVANLRSDAVQLLNQMADTQDSDTVRALAVQKLYRLSSPAEASNIAVAQLAKGPYGDLVRETINSVSSGDVDLTPGLRTALTTAVRRPGASAEERQQFDQLLARRG